MCRHHSICIKGLAILFISCMVSHSELGQLTWQMETKLFPSSIYSIYFNRMHVQRSHAYKTDNLIKTDIYINKYIYIQCVDENELSKIFKLCFKWSTLLKMQTGVFKIIFNQVFFSLEIVCNIYIFLSMQKI